MGFVFFIVGIIVVFVLLASVMHSETVEDNGNEVQEADNKEFIQDKQQFRQKELHESASQQVFLETLGEAIKGDGNSLSNYRGS